MRTDSSDSPQTLPLKGYTVDQLSGYILRQLGSPVWEVELTKQHVLDAIQDALGKLSIWRPLPRYGAIRLINGQTKYLEGVDTGLGIVDVSFVDPTPAATEIFYGNLITPAPLFRTGLDEYDTFLRWRKTWKRVTSVEPNWLEDPASKCLWIYNPIERYHCGIVLNSVHETTTTLDHVGSNWVKDFALEKARYMYGEILAKFGGAIPSPLKDLQLDMQKREKAEERLTKLEQKLEAMQFSAPLSID